MSNIKWIVLLLSVCLMALPAWAVEDDLTIVGGDETTIREFLHVYLRDMSPPDTETMIYVGQLPDELSVDVPTPNGEVIGGIVRKGPYPTTELIFVSPDTVDSIDQFFQAEMEAIGWERMGMNYGQRGFIYEENAYADYCGPDKDIFLNINLRQISDETQVRVNINEADMYICNQGNPEEMYNNDPYLRLPKLSAPEGVTMLMNRGGGGGGGGFPGTMYSATSTWLKSDELSINELMQAYDTQLIENGWEMISTETGEHTSLSLWTFEDAEQTWSGYFTLMESATESGQYYATIMVEQVSE